MNRDYYKTPKSTPLMRFFWNSAGGDRYILERATFSDQVKYMCLGGIIVATGVMAGIAGGYAFYTIFEPRGSAIESQFNLTVSAISIIFGCVWGLMIFNLDRFIVSSTGKGDGTEAITWDELKSAFPRIVMGAIIALTISKPVEIRMFKSEIDVELHKAQMEKQREYLAEIDAIYEGRIDAEKNKIKAWNDEVETKQEEYRRLETRYLNEVQGLGSSQGRGKGKIAESIEQQMVKAGSELDDIKRKNFPLIDESYKNLSKFEQSKQKDIENGEIVSAGLDGLLERIKLAHKIAGFWISLFITLLFMAIELTPIFFKLMLTKTPYDYIEENIKELIKAEQGILIEYNYYKDKQGQERDLVIHFGKEKMNAEMKALLDVQKELTLYAVNKYREKMQQKIDENPEAFIKPQDNNSLALES